MPGGPSLTASVSVLVVAILVAAFANFQLRRDYIHRIPGVPWFGVQFVAAAVCLVMTAHLVSLLTGHDLHSSRMGY
ncbi:hypothetical protein [Dongia sp.]|uniref:hypothetical protein n=1 Tax=Dongia sp. TaxID=1977262 RepID=UPI0035B2904A